MNKLEIEGFNITLCIVQKSTSTPGKLRPRSINIFTKYQNRRHILKKKNKQKLFIQCV
jgi:hypothetical protein